MWERAVLERENKALAPAKAGKSGKSAAKKSAPSWPPALPAKCTQTSPWPDADCDRSKPSADRQRRRAVALANVILESLQKQKPHAKTDAGPGPFAGSWDWHSAVLGHWALLSMARVHTFTELEKWLTTRLSDGVLAKEFEFLKKKKKDGFEVPYGRAWLLVVLLELRRRGRKSAQLTEIARGLEDDVLGYLERSTLPERKNGNFIGTHDSWLFAYLLIALSEPVGDAPNQRLAALRKKKLDPARGKIAAATPAKGDFMDLPAVLALIDRVDPIFPGKAAALVPGSSPPLEEPPLTSATNHTPGVALVQVWPHAVEARLGDKSSCSRFHARMNEMFTRTDHWADAFEHVAHWVPGFMWMGLWLEAGRP